MVVVVDVVEGGGEAGDRVGAGVAMEHIKVLTTNFSFLL